MVEIICLTVITVAYLAVCGIVIYTFFNKEGEEI